MNDNSKKIQVLVIVAIVLGSIGTGFAIYATYSPRSGIINTYFDDNNPITTLLSGERKNLTDVAITFNVLTIGVSILINFHSRYVADNDVETWLYFTLNGVTLNTSTYETADNETAISLFHVVSSLSVGTHTVKVVAFNIVGTGQVQITHPILLVQTFYP